jgi:hypothetical protein
MDLRNFVTETLTQIVEGVADAKARIQAIDPEAKVNPVAVESGTANRHGTASPVEFDVALVVADESTEATGAKAGGSVGFLSVVTARVSSELQSQSGGSQRSESVSRVKFTVQLAQPADFKEYRKLSDAYGGESYKVV